MIGNALGYAAVTCIVVMAGGCARPETGVRSSEPETPPVRDYAVPAPARETEASKPVELPPESPESAQRGAGPAVVALLERARQEDGKGQTQQAVATLERALQIEPRNSQLYRQLAVLRLKLGQAEQAEGLALKSNSLAGNDRQLQARNWRLVAECRRARQDEAGASEAERRAQGLLMGSPTAH